MTTAVADRTLTTVDRCDRCGAQAYVRVVLGASGGELLFCAHHARARSRIVAMSFWEPRSCRLQLSS